MYVCNVKIRVQSLDSSMNIRSRVHMRKNSGWPVCNDSMH